MVVSNCLVSCAITPFRGRNQPTYREYFTHLLPYKKYQQQQIPLHPRRLTWNIIMGVWKIIFLSKWVTCRFHVNLPGCSWKKITRKIKIKATLWVVGISGKQLFLETSNTSLRFRVWRWCSVYTRLWWWKSSSSLLMVQKSGVHHLRLVVYSIIYKVSYILGG